MRITKFAQPTTTRYNACALCISKTFFLLPSITLPRLFFNFNSLCDLISQVCSQSFKRSLNVCISNVIWDYSWNAPDYFPYQNIPLLCWLQKHFIEKCVVIVVFGIYFVFLSDAGLDGHSLNSNKFIVAHRKLKTIGPSINIIATLSLLSSFHESNLVDTPHPYLTDVSNHFYDTTEIIFTITPVIFWSGAKWEVREEKGWNFAVPWTNVRYEIWEMNENGKINYQMHKSNLQKHVTVSSTSNGNMIWPLAVRSWRSIDE